MPAGAIAHLLIPSPNKSPSFTAIAHTVFSEERLAWETSNSFILRTGYIVYCRKTPQNTL